MKPIQMLLSQNQTIFSIFFSAFPESPKNLKYFEKKDEPQRWFVSEIIDCKKRGYLNAQKAAYHNSYGESTCERVRNTA